MDISIARGELLDALSTVGKGISSRSTLPILSGILFDASGETVTMQSTDLEISIKHACPARVDEPGQIVVPGKLLTEIVRSLPEAAVNISKTSPDKVSVSCLQSRFDVKTLSPEDFPKFPEVSPDRSAAIPTQTLVSVVRQVGKAVSRDDARVILTGILLSIDGAALKMVATDSYRLAVREVLLEAPVSEQIEVVVPGKAMEEVPRLAKSDVITIGVTENQIVFTFGNTVFVSRRVEGQFPNYRNLIPATRETRATVDRGELMDAVKRVSLMAQHNAPVRAKVDIENKTLTLTAQTQDVGDACEDVEIHSAEGEPVEIAFNHTFLTDGIVSAAREGVDGDEVSLDIVSPLKPGVIRTPGDEGFTYLIMPVRLG